jgi:hypothetical protein
VGTHAARAALVVGAVARSLLRLNATVRGNVPSG